MTESWLPVFQQAAYSYDDVRIYLNSDDVHLNLMFRSVGENLINRVDPETGRIEYLQGTQDEISKAYDEISKRIEKMNEFLEQRK